MKLYNKVQNFFKNISKENLALMFFIIGLISTLIFFDFNVYQHEMDNYREGYADALENLTYWANKYCYNMTGNNLTCAFKRVSVRASGELYAYYNEDWEESPVIIIVNRTIPIGTDISDVQWEVN